MAQGAAVQRQIDAISKKLNAALSDVMSIAARSVHANLTDDPLATETGTPVDTGWSYTNWLTTVGTPITSPLGSKRNVPFGTHETLSDALSSYRYSPSTAVIFISNNVPYINELNQGPQYSPQQRPGFVQRAIVQTLTVDLPGALGNRYG